MIGSEWVNAVGREKGNKGDKEGREEREKGMRPSGSWG